MFNNIANFASLLNKMQDFSGKIQEMNERSRAIRVRGTAGGGLVEVEANALNEILDCVIDPGVFAQGDHEFLEDLLITATNDALTRAKQSHAETMQSFAASMGLPHMEGMQDILGKLGL